MKGISRRRFFAERCLTNSLLQSHDNSSIFFNTAAHSDFPE